MVRRDCGPTTPIPIRPWSARWSARAIRGLAGRDTDAEAWEALFRYFNAGRGKGEVGYVPGEKIAIKINNTLCHNASTTTLEKQWSYRYNIDTSPQMIVALLGQLVNVVGVAQEDISIGDPGRIMPGFIYDRVHPEFPAVQYLSNPGGLGRTAAEFSNVPFYWSTPAAVGTKQDFLPKSFAQADYFINLAILKSHDQGGITVCGKNLYGALLRNPDGSLGGKKYNYYDLHSDAAEELPRLREVPRPGGPDGPSRTRRQDLALRGGRSLRRPQLVLRACPLADAALQRRLALERVRLPGPRRDRLGLQRLSCGPSGVTTRG